MDRIAECSQGWSFNLSISFHTIWWSLMALMFENKLKKDIFICFVLFRISVRFCIITCNYCAAAAGCRTTLTPVCLYHLVASQYPKLRWFCTFCTERKGHKNWATRKTSARLSPPLNSCSRFLSCAAMLFEEFRFVPFPLPGHGKAAQGMVSLDAVSAVSSFAVQQEFLWSSTFRDHSINRNTQNDDSIPFIVCGLAPSTPPSPPSILLIPAAHQWISD